MISKWSCLRADEYVNLKSGKFWTRNRSGSIWMINDYWAVSEISKRVGTKTGREPSENPLSSGQKTEAQYKRLKVS